MQDTDGKGNVYQIEGEQVLQFKRYELVDGRLELIHDGTTEEELIRVAIDRLGKSEPSRPNYEIMSILVKSLTWFLAKTRRQDRL